MDFMQSVKSCFSQYVGFSGRAARSEYWWFFLFQFLVSIVLSFLGDIASLLALGLLLPALAVGARRLHDINKSGWLQLIWLIPLIGWAIMIYWHVQPSDAGSNNHGAPPSSGGTSLVPGQQ